MNTKEYQILNNYLNEICLYLEENDQFLLEYIDKLYILNDFFADKLFDYKLNNQTKSNKITFMDVFNLAREVISNIDINYLEQYDNLIKKGELDFSYHNDYPDSECVIYHGHSFIRKLININREFNYNDICTLVHEFIHYIHGDNDTNNEYYLAEFLAIYFELYSLDYLIDQGINKEEIDYLYRIKEAKKSSIIFYRYELILLAYIKFGNINSETYQLLQEFYHTSTKESFLAECQLFYKNLNIIIDNNQDLLDINPNLLGYVLCREFISYNYRYILGTILAIYAHKYCDFNDIVNLNNSIGNTDKSVSEILLSIGIDINSKDFLNNVLEALDDYLNKKIIGKSK